MVNEDSVARLEAGLWYQYGPWGDIGGRAPGHYDFSVLLPSPKVLPYILLVLLAIAALGLAAIALLRTS